jgi:hypothetical protein
MGEISQYTANFQTYSLWVEGLAAVFELQAGDSWITTDMVDVDLT